MTDLTIYEDLEQGSEEWLAARCGVITASVIGQLITPQTIRAASNDKSRALIAQLAAERITGRTEPVYVNRHMERGNMGEPLARDLYAEHQGVEVQQVGFMVREFAGGVSVGYSPDGLVGDDGLIEVKCPEPKTHLATIVKDRVPSEYMPQVQCGLLVSGRAWCDFISYVGGMRPYFIRVTPDPKWHDAIICAATEFERAVAETINTYEARTAGLPLADLIPDLEVVI